MVNGSSVTCASFTVVPISAVVVLISSASATTVMTCFTSPNCRVRFNVSRLINGQRDARLDQLAEAGLFSCDLVGARNEWITR